jgi:hypothetical protein
LITCGDAFAAEMSILGLHPLWEAVDKIRFAFPAVMLDTNVTMRAFSGGVKMIWESALFCASE